MMKKLFLVAIAATFVFASCGTKKQDANAENTDSTQCADKAACCQMTEEQKAECAKWQDWDNQDEATQIELLNNWKAKVDEKMATCETPSCPEKAQKCEEFKAKLANWENMTIAEKKALADECKANCCKKEGEECCKKEAEPAQ
jgi:hypothetical protein